MFREAVAADETKSEAERRHHQTAALYFSIATIEAFLNRRMRDALSMSKSEEEILETLRNTRLMNKVRKWPSDLIGKSLTVETSRVEALSEFNELRASLTHPKTKGHDVYGVLEKVKPMEIVDTVAEYIVRFHESEGTRYPYWIFGWNYLNPEREGHEILVLNDQQFVFSLRTLGMRIPGGYGWEEDWKNRFMKTFDGYIQIRDLLSARKACEPRFSDFPCQPKLCARWWMPQHHSTCGAVGITPPK